MMRYEKEILGQLDDQLYSFCWAAIYFLLQCVKSDLWRKILGPLSAMSIVDEITFVILLLVEDEGVQKKKSNKLKRTKKKK